VSIWAKTWAYEQHPKRLDENGEVTEKKHPAAKAMLVALAEFPGPGQRVCWPSQKTLADMTDFTERQVRSCLSDLEAQGLIKRERRNRGDGSRRSDRITLLGPIKAFGPAQDGDEEAPAETARPTGREFRGAPEESSGHEPSVEPGVEANASSEVKTSPQTVALEKHIVDGIYAAMRANRTPLDDSDFGYHLGRAQAAVRKMEPTDAELDELPAAFVREWTIRGRADAKSALVELRRQAARPDLVRQDGPAPWEPINPHSPREMRISADELERRRKQREEMGRLMAEARERDLAGGE
jgi:hypothetical protein